MAASPPGVTDFASLSRWQLRSTGNFAVTEETSGRDVTPRGRKARAIIAYLASRPDSQVSRERLAELLWGDRAEPQARASLRQALLEIRHAAPGLILSDRELLWINREQVRFDQPVAGAMHGGQYIPFENLDNASPEFDEWLEGERGRRTRALTDELRSRVKCLLEAGRNEAALALIETMQRIDPYDEDAARFAMQAEFQAGRAGGIEQHYQNVAALLQGDLGVEPSGETKALRDELLGRLGRRSDGGERTGPMPATPSSRFPARPLASQSPALGKLRGHRIVAMLLAAILAGAAAAWWTFGGGRQAMAAGPDRYAVLPFRALGGVDPATADGMAEEVLTQLSRQREIETVGRNSSWMFRDAPADLRRVGRQLDVDYIVEGTVRKSGTALRATVALVDAKDASTIWSKTFVTASADAQQIEDSVSRALMQQLGLAPPDLDRRINPLAYGDYVRAKAIIRSRYFASFGTAQDLLLEAVRLEPDFAPAWAQLGIAINFKRDYGENDSRKAGAWQKRAELAARKAIAIDPKLADGHATLAFVLGFDTVEGQAHLRHALKLEPNNPQVLYWSATVAGSAGDQRLSSRLALRAMEIDPLWLRPVEVAAKNALLTGRRALADGYVRRLRSADLGAAVEVEMGLARFEGNLSRVVELGHRDSFVTSRGAARYLMGSALIELGYAREALLLTHANSFDRALALRQLPDRSAIFASTSGMVGAGEELDRLMPIVVELARADRHADIVGLYDRPGSRLYDLRNGKVTRAQQVVFGGLVGRSLAKQGRITEAARLMRGAEDAGRIFMSQHAVEPSMIMEIASNHAIMGQRAEAISRIEQAVAKGWIAFEGANYEMGEMPWFATLLGNPRFERARKVVRARLERERRETAALGFI